MNLIKIRRQYKDKFSLVLLYILQGNTSVNKLAAFMDQLIDIVYILDTAEDPHKKAMLSPGVVRLVLV